MIIKGFVKVDVQKVTYHEINFVPLSPNYFKVMHKWFNTKHVQKFYSLRDWTLEEVIHEFTPRIHQVDGTQGYIIHIQDMPIGYIQFYVLADYPSPQQNFSREIIQNGAGIDLFMGENDFLGKGISYHAFEMFLTLYIWPKFTYCVVDPDVNNRASKNFFKKLRFKEHKIIDTKDALGCKVQLQLMIKRASEEYV